MRDIRGRTPGVLVLAVGATVTAVLAGSGAEPPKVGPRIEFETTVINLGVVSEEQELEAIFRFTNTGDQPLEIRGYPHYVGGSTYADWQSPSQATK